MGTMGDEERRTVWILGAGFSRSLGGPLLLDLLSPATTQLVRSLYCAGECRAIRRRESARRAGATYQRSPKGARKHAARQRQRRLAKFSAQKVTHHAFTPDPDRVIVASSSASSVDVEDRHGTVADDTAGRGPRPDTIDHESRGQRPDQGASTETDSAVISAGPHRDDWLGSETWGDDLWPAESALVHFDFAIPPSRAHRPLRGVGDFRDVRRPLRLVRSK
jgi:hypothetical protein